MAAAMNRFNDFLAEAELFDLGYQGPDFTWRRGSMWERLDRILGNSKWVQAFPFTVISHLAMAGSDHRSLLCTIQNAESPLRAPFRFQNMWTLHPQFMDVVGKVWRSEGDTNPWINLWKLLKKVASKLRQWNWDTIGNIHENLIQAQNKVIKGKAAVTKFMEEDRNSRYYHACINFRRKNNMILSIQDSAGQVLTDAEYIAQDAVNYFQNIFKEQSPSRAQIKMDTFSDCKDYVHNLNLNNTPLEGEIKAALDSFDDQKVVGPDGFTTKFNKATWNIICGEFVDAVQSFFRGIDPPNYFTVSTITLIPKNSSRMRWGDFRPISLTNVISKVISKIMSTRLQPHLQQLISKNQMFTMKKGTQIRLGRMFNKFLWAGQKKQFHWTVHPNLAKKKVGDSRLWTKLSEIWMPSGINMKVSKPTLVLWTPPLKGWLKANIDGNFSKEAAGVGGVIRNSLGKCIFYFSSPTWANDELETEMIAIFWAIYLSKQCNIPKLVIESDSSRCIKILNNVEAAP
ncbi:uncharacterized protein LOC110034571 [Phalaenopsis equestris]|uniref:uncharacterized protein LOC110034571 n=1 Tax=Phalaenopsis equestris TaxID=78828 RepID=UPI0009E37282|nr:uncharacterized protein LOC110034571 [Phalaenopsis equestris]